MRRGWSVAVLVVGLGGMAYCHAEDVSMKFDEHVYYMAALFCCNIAASLALIPLVVLAEQRPRLRRATWAAAGALAAATILGFLWSRTVGFPQMEDHVGEWDALGLASLGFEAAVLAASVGLLRRHAGRPRVPYTLGSGRAPSE